MCSWSFLIIASMFFVRVNYNIIGENIFLNALNIGFSRILWTVHVAWIIFACHSGIGGFVNKFLSSKVWIPMSKIGYSFYLVHPILMYNFNASREVQINLDLPNMVRKV